MFSHNSRYTLLPGRPGNEVTMASKHWPDLDAYLREAGETVTQGQIFNWMKRVDFANYLSRRGFIPWVARAYVKAPAHVQTLVSAAVGAYLEHVDFPNRAEWFRRFMAAITFVGAGAARELPQAIQDQIEDGKIDPHNLHAGAHVADDKKKEAAPKPAAPAPAAPDPIAVATAAKMAAAEKRKEEGRKELEKMTPYQRANRALFKAIMVLRERDILDRPIKWRRLRHALEQIGSAPGAIKALEDLTIEAAELETTNAAIEWLNQWYERGGWDQDYGLDALAEPGAWNRFTVWLDDQWNRPRSLRLFGRELFSWQGRPPPTEADLEARRQAEQQRAAARAQAERIRDADMAEYERQRAVVYATLNRFNAFVAALEDATYDPEGLEWAQITALDSLDEFSTARGRAQFKRGVRRQWRGIRQVVTHPVFWIPLLTVAFVAFIACLVVLPALAAVLAGMAVAFGIGSGLFSFSMIVLWATAWWLVDDPYLRVLLWWAALGFNLGIVGMVASRLVVPSTDRLIDLVRKVQDFLDPADGTGLIGGSLALIPDTLRKWGVLGPRREENKEAAAARAKERGRYALAFWERSTLVIVAASLIGVGMNLLFAMYDTFTVIGALSMVAALLVLHGAELFARGRTRYLPPEEEDEHLLTKEFSRRYYQRMIGVVGMAFGGVLSLSLCAGFGLNPDGADETLEVTQAGSQAVVYSLAKRYGLQTAATCIAATEEAKLIVKDAGRTLAFLAEGNHGEFPVSCAYFQEALEAERDSVAEQALLVPPDYDDCQEVRAKLVWKVYNQGRTVEWFRKGHEIEYPYVCAIYVEPPPKTATK
jgi:hypothetical protein